MTTQSNTMSPRAQAAVARVQKENRALEHRNRQSFVVLVGMWVLFSGLAFKDLVQAESVRLVDVLIPVGMSLGYAAIIAFAWSRLSRRKEPALK